jgi:hypothetical protein
VFADVVDGGCFPLFAEGRLIDATLHLMKVFKIVGRPPHRRKELFRPDGVRRRELGRDRLQPHCAVAEGRGVAVNIVRNLRPPQRSDHLQQFATVLRAAEALLRPRVPRHENVDAAVLYDEQPRGGGGGDEPFVGGEESFLQPPRDFGLQRLRPMTEKENAAFYYGERVFVVDFCVGADVPWRSSSFSLSSTRFSSSTFSSSPRT